MERKCSPVSQCSGAKIFENNFWPKINLAKKNELQKHSAG